MSPRIKFRGDYWIYGSNLSSTTNNNHHYGSPDLDVRCFEQDHNLDDNQEVIDSFRFAHALDVDVRDGSGNIYQVRVLWNNGSADANTGYYGKAFDRTSIVGSNDHKDPVVLAEILSSGDCSTKLVVTEALTNTWVDHKGPLEDLFHLLKGKQQSMSPGEFDHQFAMLLGLSQNHQQERSSPVVWKDASPLQIQMLRRLGKHCQGSPNETNVAAQVLCSDQPGLTHLRELIGQYSAQNYYYCYATTETQQQQQQQDESMMVYIQSVWKLVKALKLEAAGDREGAVKMCRAWVDSRDVSNNWILDRDEFQAFLDWDYNFKATKAKEFLEKFRPLALGWDKDETMNKVLDNIMTAKAKAEEEARKLEEEED